MVNNIDMCSCLFPPIHSIICLFFPVVSQRHLSARTPHLSSKSVTCIPAWPVQIWSTDLTRSNGLCCLPLAILFVSNMCCTIVQFPAWHSAHCASSPLVWAIPPRLPARLHQTPAGFVFPWLEILRTIRLAVFDMDLVGGWATPLKNMSSSVGIIIPNWMEKIRNVPNHQPVIVGVPSK